MVESTPPQKKKLKGLVDPTHDNFFYKLLFHPKMTPKTHKKRIVWKSGKSDFEKSSGLPASFDGPKQPKKYFIYQTIANMEIYQLYFNHFSKFSLCKKFLLWL